MEVARTENPNQGPTAPMTHNNQSLRPEGQEGGSPSANGGAEQRNASGKADEMQKTRKGIERTKEIQQSTRQGTGNNTPFWVTWRLQGDWKIAG